jgi:3-isopropylmalate/(R)-2-methylmalate dehydratase small subunit
VSKGDVLRVDVASGQVINETTGAILQAQPFSPYVMSILTSGGIKPLIKDLLQSQGIK